MVNRMLMSPLVALLVTTNLAQASECYSIRDADMKNQCLAVTQNRLTNCYSIKNPDLKNSCLAQVKNHKSSCYSIKDKDQKNRCLANFD